MSVGRDYFKAVYDVTIFYEGFGNGEDNSGKTANPPNVFCECAFQPINLISVLFATLLLYKGPTN